jgi:hypothetical protein
MRNTRSAAAVLALTIVATLTISAARAAESGVALMELYLLGSFTSEAQAARDSSFSPVDIRVEPVKLARADVVEGPWLLFSMHDRKRDVWQQALYRLRQDPGEITVVESYRLFRRSSQPPDNKPVTPDEIAKRRLESIVYLSGCDVYFTLGGDGVFRGAHQRGTCKPATLKVAYIYADKTVGPEGMMFWERGYDERDRPVWGPEKGGYVFARMKP